MQLSKGTRWLDTHSSGVRVAGSTLTLLRAGDARRRIVTITGKPERLMIEILATWQRKRDGVWETVSERRSHASVSSFCTPTLDSRRYRPLYEDPELVDDQGPRPLYQIQGTDET